MKRFQILLFLLISTFSLHAQEKTNVAIMPFVPAIAEYKSRASQLQGMVVEILSKKSDIHLIDRSNDTLLMKELDNQIREQSMAAPGLVEQGKVLGAQNMVVGTLSNVNVESKTSSGVNVFTKKAYSTTTYEASISFSLQLLDVETGSIISNKSFNSNDKTGWLSLGGLSGGSSKEEALSNAMSTNRKQILQWINECYPPNIKILKIEDRDKKGAPATILITGVDGSLAVGTRLDLKEVEAFDAGDGKTLTRKKVIGSLKISDKQGDITVCKVTDGGKVIEEKMTANAKLEVVLK